MKIVFTGILVAGISLACQAHAATGPGSAAAYAKVLVAQGEVKLGRKTYHSGDSISDEGVLSTSTDGAAKIELIPSHTVLQIMAGSDVILRRPRADEPEQVAIQQGTARATVVKKPSAKKPVFMIKTHSATMGVRGTDFMAIVNPIFDESEVIVFDGSVELGNDQDPRDRKLVPKDDWGGIGGRFGAKTHALIHLPARVIRHFEKITTVSEHGASAGQGGGQ